MVAMAPAAATPIGVVRSARCRQAIVSAARAASAGMTMGNRSANSGATTPPAATSSNAALNNQSGSHGGKHACQQRRAENRVVRWEPGWQGHADRGGDNQDVEADAEHSPSLVRMAFKIAERDHTAEEDSEQLNGEQEEELVGAELPMGVRSDDRCC